MTSDKVYGAQASPEAIEADPLLGLHPYDASKVCADVIARSYAAAFGLPIAVARCANIYGGGDLNYSRIVPYAVRCVLLGEPILLRGDGTSRREFLFVQDAVAALLALATNLDCDGIRGRAFNFGSNETVTVLSLVRQIAEAAARPDYEIVPAPSPAPGELVCQRLNSSLAKRLLSWRREVDLATGLERTVDWYRAFYGGLGHGHRR
jgi:CDP-glucose 4,6-dehydratase